MSMDTQNCISSNVVSLQIPSIEGIRARGPSEEVSKAAHVHVLPFRKAAHAPSNPQRVAGSETADNERMRADRKEVWCKAKAKLEFWETTYSWLLAIRHGQHCGVEEAIRQSPSDLDKVLSAFDQSRHATMALLLTAAPDLASVEWKRRYISRRRRSTWDEATEQQIVGMIEADQAWLDAHPARQPKRKK